MRALRPRARALHVLALASLAFGGSKALAAEALVDGIAAQVGSKIVLISEVMDMVAPMEAEFRARGATDADIATVRMEALERMIEWRLLESIVAQAELSASEADIEQAMDAIAKDNGVTREELLANVESHGLRAADYRAQLRREIERSRVVQAVVGPKIKIEEDAVKRLFDERYGNQPSGGDQLHLRQILIPYGEGAGRSKDEACAAVAAAAARIESGERFEVVASETSAVASERGGDLGWVMAAELASWMSEVVKDLSPGQRSGVVELDGACSLLELVDRQDYAPVTFETARPMLEREIRGRLEVQEYQSWLDKMRENTFIERRGPFAAAPEEPVER